MATRENRSALRCSCLQCCVTHHTIAQILSCSIRSTEKILFTRVGFRVVAIWLLGSWAVCAHAMELHSINSEYVNGEYRLTMTATLTAHSDRVEAILRDYAHYKSLDTRILDAHVVSRPQTNQVQLFTRIRVCISLLCRNVDRIELVEERPLELLATIIAAKSDAERGGTHTVLIADGERTQVRYTTSIVPKFWVPALFGRNIMLHTLRDATISMFENIEKRAQ